MTLLSSLILLVFGGLLTHWFGKIQSRSKRLSWSATFQKILTGEPSDFASQKVTLFWGEHKCTNARTCEIELRNESGRDVEDLDVLVTFNSPFIIVEVDAGLLHSRKNLLVSPAYQKTLAYVAGLPQEQRALNPSGKYIQHNREFRIPALNRGCAAKFILLVVSTINGVEAEATLSTEKVGVKLIQKRYLKKFLASL